MYKALKKKMIASMKAKEKETTTIYKMLKSQVDTHCKEKKITEPTDADVIHVVKKQLKDKRKVLVDYKKHAREDLVTLTNKEIEIYSEFLPIVEMFSKKETDDLIDKQFSDVSILSDTNINKIRGGIMKGLSTMKDQLDWDYVIKTVNTKINELVVW